MWFVQILSAKNKKYFGVWRCVVEMCVLWWCKKHSIVLPDDDSRLYQDLKHDALFYLRSEIPNNNGLYFIYSQYTGTFYIFTIFYILYHYMMPYSAGQTFRTFSSLYLVAHSPRENEMCENFDQQCTICSISQANCSIWPGLTVLQYLGLTVLFK